MREFMDGKYLGTLSDGLKDGVFKMTIADVTSGAHTLALILDGSTTGASYAFTKLASGAVVGGTGNLPPVIVPPVVVSPVVPTPLPKMAFIVSSVTEDHGQLLISGSKSTGGPNTIREFMDNNYLGVVQDGRPDGSFAMDIADVSVGAHSLTLTLDGNNNSATYGFTKTAGGTVTALTPATVTHVVLPILTHS